MLETSDRLGVGTSKHGIYDEELSPCLQLSTREHEGRYMLISLTTPLKKQPNRAIAVGGEAGRSSRVEKDFKD